MPCNLTITDVQSNPPYGGSGQPLTLFIRGVSDPGCNQIIITVRENANGLLLFPVTSVNATSQGAANPNQQLWQVSFTLNPNFAPHFRLSCGSFIHVEARCANDENCVHAVTREIICKEIDDTITPPPPPPPPTECDGIELPIIGCVPGLNCLGFKRYFAFAVTLALYYCVVGVSVPGGTAFVTAGAFLVLAAVFYGAMALICPPSHCTLRRLVCWAFKWGSFLGLIYAVSSLNLMGIMLALIYGAIAGWLEILLSRNLCRRPIMMNLPV